MTTATITINGVETAVPAEAVAYKYADAVEDARWLTDADEAREIEQVDPSLIVWVPDERQAILTGLAGKNYNSVRDQIAALDWSDCYPVVDIDGDLTGEIVDSQSDLIGVDCTLGGIVQRDDFVDAMFDGAAVLDDLADAMGYDRIELDDENECYSGYGCSDPTDRSRDDIGGLYVCGTDEIVATMRRHLGAA